MTIDRHVRHARGPLVLLAVVAGRHLYLERISPGLMPHPVIDAAEAVAL